MRRSIFIGLTLAIAVAVSLAFYYEKRTRVEQYPDLLGNLKYVDQVWDTKYIDLGTPTFQEALIKGWSQVKAERDGTTYVETYSKTANVQFSVFHVTGRKMQVRCRTIPGSSTSQILIPMVNGKKLRAQRIGPDFQNYTFDVSPNLLNQGMNSLTFYFSLGKENDTRKLGAAFDYVSLLPAEEASNVETLSREHTAFSELKPAMHSTWFASEKVISAPPNSKLLLYFRVPENAAMQIGYGLASAVRGSACEFAISVHPEGEGSKELTRQTIVNRVFFPASATEFLDLKQYENRVVAIELSATAVPGKELPERVFWGKARLITASTSPEAPIKSDIGQGLLANQKTNVVIYLIDAQRADHLMPYGYARPTSPVINEFAKSSVVFEKAYSQVSWTRASVASIESGLYPSSHLVEGRLDAFPDNLPNLQSELRKHGYHAYGFITNGNISSLFNFGKDFDEYIRLGEDKNRKEIHVQSGPLIDTVERYFDNNPYSTPFFLYVHATDPHAPYTADPEFSLAIDGCDINNPEMFNQKGENSRIFSKEEIDCMESLYDSETRRADHNFGRLLDMLKRKNLYDNSIIIVTGDHGESFFEHGSWGHGKTLYESEIRVPIIIHFPHNRFAGMRIPDNVRHIDLLPTLLSAFGYPVPVSVEGRSLLPFLLNHPLPEIPVYSELLLDTLSRQSMVYDGYKLIDNGKGGHYELYDLRIDPQETKNIATQEPIRVNCMRMTMNRWADEEAKRKAALKKPKGAVLDQETEDVLKALGYIQ